MSTPVPSLRDLFEAACELDDAARAAYLAAHCADSAQREQVERLLAADRDDGDGALGQDAADALQALGEAEPLTFAPGGWIGPWRLIALLGEGGSSTVFRAGRDAAGVRQEVALKLLRRGLYSYEAQRQFRRERQALAALSHPDIASLIEGGVTEQGLAYIALELVDGQAITDYACTRSLDLTARLRLFLRVCRAVEAAHRALIVHRDLKPSNVLVSADGHVKLLDFGIAKLLDADDETQTRLPAFTPAYAAPEQRCGGAVTTATDVYALGILLGELLTGQRPGDGRAHTPSGQVRDDAAPGQLPAPPQTTRRLLRGDLDNIVLKAIAEEPEQRYVSAGALAEDIERLLDGRPVAAHPPSRWYRAKKFVARHRGGVATSAAFLLALLAALGVALWQANVARDELRRANAMRDFMVVAFQEAQPSSPREGPPRITEVVEQAVARARGDAQMNPRARTELLTELATVLRIQGRQTSARDLGRWNYEQALREFGGASPLSLAAGGELAYTLFLLGDFADARTRIDGLLAQSAAAEPRLRSRLLSYSSAIATKEHDARRAIADVEAAVALARRSGDAELLSLILSSQSTAQLASGDASGAIASLKEQLAINERLYGSQHLNAASVRAALSRAYRRVGDLPAAEREIRAALDIDAAVLPNDDWRRARHLNALMILQHSQRNFDAALASGLESLRINRIAYADDHPEIANDLENLGRLELQLEQPAAAKELLREALARSTARLGAEHADTAGVRASYGEALVRIGDRAAGEAELRHALVSLGTAPDRDVEARVCEQFARLYLDLDDAARALPLLDRIDTVLAPALADSAYWDGRIGVLRGVALLGLDRAGPARDVLTAAEAALAASKAADPSLQIEVALRQAQAAQHLGDTAAAQRYATLGRTRLAALRNPPGRLVRLAAALPAAAATVQ
ncbi:protein kinase [Tahibacter sp. UC22_41]|uniref:serine/threonine-protein kinase n=1 Tax=Tahibacter sp. UC22_41 TaxID=3350178 RepID=UPI0036DE1632